MESSLVIDWNLNGLVKLKMLNTMINGISFCHGLSQLVLQFLH